jgi:hypothetical protein
MMLAIAALVTTGCGRSTPIVEGTVMLDGVTIKPGLNKHDFALEGGTAAEAKQ